ncbi:SCP2 sterol-binding domain-containing protein [Candidatus Thorarchaeota archaeon]|jgi:putative sterol carrier protein|nr:MAG: SCP2 sterol-binding domain-containing protein [Candidatus Thorarchaeota archaeon]
MSDELLELMRERIAIGLERDKTKEAIDGWERTALLSLKDGREYSFVVKDNNILVESGGVESPDMQIQSDDDTIRKLFLEEMSAAKALVTRKLKVKGSAGDLMKIRHIF